METGGEASSNTDKNILGWFAAGIISLLPLIIAIGNNAVAFMSSFNMNSGDWEQLGCAELWNEWCQPRTACMCPCHGLLRRLPPLVTSLGAWWPRGGSCLGPSHGLRPDAKGKQVAHFFTAVAVAGFSTGPGCSLLAPRTQAMVAMGSKLGCRPPPGRATALPRAAAFPSQPRGAPGAEWLRALGLALCRLHGSAVTPVAGLQLEPGAGLFLAQGAIAELRIAGTPM